MLLVRKYIRRCRDPRAGPEPPRVPDGEGEGAYSPEPSRWVWEEDCGRGRRRVDRQMTTGPAGASEDAAPRLHPPFLPPHPRSPPRGAQQRASGQGRHRHAPRGSASRAPSGGNGQESLQRSRKVSSAYKRNRSNPNWQCSFGN